MNTPHEDNTPENYNSTSMEEIENSLKQMIEKRNRRKESKLRKKYRRVMCMVWIPVLIAALVLAGGIYFMKPYNPKKGQVVNTHPAKPSAASGSLDISAASDLKATEIPPEKTGFEKYAHIPYSDEALAERYDAYSLLNPSMSVEDVVWRVNANLDKPKYEYDVPASGYDDPYIIVNKYYTVPEDFRPPDLQSFDGFLMRSETGKAYTEMRNAAAAEGYSIRAVSAYRTVEYQRNLYNSYLAGDAFENVERYSARPGHSEHHTGMAIDLFGSTDGLRNFQYTPEYPWVKENCHKFGFIIRYTETGEEITGYEFEPWHIRYVGTAVSTDMKLKHIDTYEEYYAKYLYEKQ